MLLAAGLDPERIDPVETAEDLAARAEMSATLDALVADEDEPAPRFDAEWR